MNTLQNAECVAVAGELKCSFDGGRRYREMFGAFRPTQVVCGGLLSFAIVIRKIPWRLSRTRKANQRHRLKAVDSVIAAVAESGVDTLSLRRAMELPKEHEMPARDKYTVYSKKGRDYRKGVHKVPKFTRLTLRTNPKGF